MAGILKERVLVLNKSWAVISTITVKGAMILLFRDKASVVCPHTYAIFGIDEWMKRSKDKEEGIKTSSGYIAKPEVVIIKNYVREPRRKIAFTRRNLAKRDDNMCQYCLAKNASKFTIDHVLPRSKGGETCFTNCVLACSRCNTKKSDKSLSEIGFVLNKKPITPDWSPYLELDSSRIPEVWRKFVR